jgi:hypothetical protein
LLDLLRCEIRDKPDRTYLRRRGPRQRCKASAIQQRPRRLYPAKPGLDGGVLQHAGRYHLREASRVWGEGVDLRSTQPSDQLRRDTLQPFSYVGHAGVEQVPLQHRQGGWMMTAIMTAAYSDT